MAYTPPNAVSYFYGRLLREECVSILNRRGCKNGLYLLRERLEEIGSYTLSICSDGEIFHYKIDRQDDGTVKMEGGRKFIGPIELIKYHQTDTDGLVMRPQIPCERPRGVSSIQYFFINNSDLYTSIENEIRTNCKTQLEILDARGRYRYKYERVVLKNIHLKQPWLIKNINRSQSNELLTLSGLINGKFLLRFNPEAPLEEQFKLSICFQNEVKHYKINYLHEIGKYSLDGGKKFDLIIQLIDYYHRCTDGLCTKLHVPYLPNIHTITKINSQLAKQLSISPSFNLINYDQSVLNDLYESNRTYAKLLDLNNVHFPGLPQTQHQIQQQHETSPQGSERYMDDEPNNLNEEDGLNNIPAQKRALFEDDYNYVYDDNKLLPKFYIDQSDLIIYDKLGAGCFGYVTRGTYLQRDTNSNIVNELPVAIKTLNITGENENEQDVQNAKNEIIKEAERMQLLNHKHIIKFIGMCNNSKSSCMIVLELARLGPLHKYLRNHKNMQIFKIIRILYQVACAMQYIAAKNLVHRDLAARNVLLASEDLAKISDFGMSRKMNEHLYYISKTQGKWPLKWYPPEAAQTSKFDEKSDVWSFGITCWEATSYGCRPYQGIDVHLVLLKLQNGYRLDKPDECPDDVYNLMYKCWNIDRARRPSFNMIVDELKQMLFNLYDLHEN